MLEFGSFYIDFNGVYRSFRTSELLFLSISFFLAIRFFLEIFVSFSSESFYFSPCFLWDIAFFFFSFGFCTARVTDLRSGGMRFRSSYSPTICLYCSRVNPDYLKKLIFQAFNILYNDWNSNGGIYKETP